MTNKRKKVLILNGPNLNLLGTREKNIYGNETLGEIEKKAHDTASKLNIDIDFVQSNHEGELIDEIHQARGTYDVILINPGAFTHYSYAIRDAIKASEIKAVEIHISNIYSREEWRSKSVIAPVCVGQISGFMFESYILGLHAALNM